MTNLKSEFNTKMIKYYLDKSVRVPYGAEKIELILLEITDEKLNTNVPAY